MGQLANGGGEGGGGLGFMNKMKRPGIARQNYFSVNVGFSSPTPPPPLTNGYKATTCHTERKKIKNVRMKAGIIAVLAGVDIECRANSIDIKKRDFFLILVPPEP